MTVSKRLKQENLSPMHQSRSMGLKLRAQKDRACRDPEATLERGWAPGLWDRRPGRRPLAATGSLLDLVNGERLLQNLGVGELVEAIFGLCVDIHCRRARRPWAILQ